MTTLIDAYPRATLPAEAEALREPIKQFITANISDLPPHERARTWSGFDAEFSRKLGEAGWLGLQLPEEYGGAGRDAFARFVVVEELLAAGAPIAAHWIGDRQSAPLLVKYGTEEQRQKYIPDICAGKSFFCIGMSEPNSGSDLVSVRTKAEQNNDGWLLNGSKIWTTYAHRAHYMIALVRTSGTPDDRHAGLSQLLIDLSLPGITANPIALGTGDSDFSEVHFDNVQLPPDALIGEEGNGWAQVTAELAFERSGPERIYSSLILLDLWIAHLRKSATDADIEQLGRFVAQVSALRAMSISVAAKIVEGESPAVEAALVKDLGTEFEQAIPERISDLAGGSGKPVDPELMRTLAYLMQLNHTFSLRGGTREILRGMIARGLGLR